jgi:hypothetical protein
VLSKVLAAYADSRRLLGALLNQFKVVLAHFRVSHAQDIPTQVEFLVGAERRPIFAYRNPFGTLRSQRVVAEAGDVSVHFWVRLAHGSRFGFDAVKIVVNAFNGFWLVEENSEFQSDFTIFPLFC